MDLGKPVRMGHPGLVGLPLFLIMVFCFALVMVHPGDQTNDVRSSSTETVSNESAASLKAEPKTKKKLSPVNQSKHPTAKVVALPSATSQVNVSPGNGGTPSATGTPQPNGQSPSLQPAAQNDPEGRGALDRLFNQAEGTLNKAGGLLD